MRVAFSRACSNALRYLGLTTERVCVVRRDTYGCVVRRVDIGGRSVEIPVRVSRRARKLSITVDAQRNIEIVVPARATQRDIDSLLFEHRAWLERQLAKPPKVFHLGLQRDDVVWIGGLAPPAPRVPSLFGWYREQARAEIARAVDFEATRLEVTYTRVS